MFPRKLSLLLFVVEGALFVTSVVAFLALRYGRSFALVYGAGRFLNRRAWLEWATPKLRRCLRQAQHGSEFQRWLDMLEPKKQPLKQRRKR